MKPKLTLILIILFFISIKSSISEELSLIDSFQKYNSKKNYNEVFIDFANLYYKQKEFDKAKIELKKVLKNNPNNIRANYLLGKIFQIEKDYLKSNNYLNQANKFNQNNLQINLALAENNLKQGNLKKALEKLNSIIKKDSDNYKVNKLLAELNKVCSDNNKNSFKIKVKISSQKTYICKSKKLIKVMESSTGTINKPTPLGNFKIQNRAKWFFSKKYQQGGKYFVSFRDWGIYGFHSIPMDKNKNILLEEEKKLGKRASHGCVRLEVNDSKWIYDNIKQGSEVNIEY